ncbi:hypothetical protein M114_2547 [Bacteroides fragilis str. 3986 N(B)22]|nr:hypothetical protein M114_2547 [Bacteroides fragilis str. 3986 N(B)22]
MKLKITLYSVCLLMLLAACQQDGPTPEPSVGSRTVLVYMIAQNSLAPLASADRECGRLMPHPVICWCI